MNNYFEKAVSDTYGMKLENNWNVSDEEKCWELTYLFTYQIGF